MRTLGSSSKSQQSADNESCSASAEMPHHETEESPESSKGKHLQKDRVHKLENREAFFVWHAQSCSKSDQSDPSSESEEGETCASEPADNGNLKL